VKIDVLARLLFEAFEQRVEEPIVPVIFKKQRRLASNWRQRRAITNADVE
jgi:hypothetical protein